MAKKKCHLSSLIKANAYAYLLWSIIFSQIKPVELLSSVFLNSVAVSQDVVARAVVMAFEDKRHTSEFEPVSSPGGGSASDVLETTPEVTSVLLCAMYCAVNIRCQSCVLNDQSECKLLLTFDTSPDTGVLYAKNYEKSALSL